MLHSLNFIVIHSLELDVFVDKHRPYDGLSFYMVKGHSVINHFFWGLQPHW